VNLGTETKETKSGILCLQVEKAVAQRPRISTADIKSLGFADAMKMCPVLHVYDRDTLHTVAVYAESRSTVMALTLLGRSFVVNVTN
jgi:hypothetical protein